MRLIQGTQGRDIKDTILLIDRIKRNAADLIRDIDTQVERVDQEIISYLARDLSVACLQMQEGVPLGISIALDLATIERYITSRLNGEEVDLDSFYEETKRKLYMSI